MAGYVVRRHRTPQFEWTLVTIARSCTRKVQTTAGLVLSAREESYPYDPHGASKSDDLCDLGHPPMPGRFTIRQKTGEFFFDVRLAV